jgi:hypothetical protein
MAQGGTLIYSPADCILISSESIGGIIHHLADGMINGVIGLSRQAEDKRYGSINAEFFTQFNSPYNVLLAVRGSIFFKNAVCKAVTGENDGKPGFS